MTGWNNEKRDARAEEEEEEEEEEEGTYTQHTHTKQKDGRAKPKGTHARCTRTSTPPNKNVHHRQVPQKEKKNTNGGPTKECSIYVPRGNGSESVIGFRPRNDVETFLFAHIALPRPIHPPNHTPPNPAQHEHKPTGRNSELISPDPPKPQDDRTPTACGSPSAPSSWKR